MKVGVIKPFSTVNCSGSRYSDLIISKPYSTMCVWAGKQGMKVSKKGVRSIGRREGCLLEHAQVQAALTCA